MSGFKALNIESDDESDVEIDDTKELQIEDALKLYQAALKYHSEGPASFDLAAQAYEELFQSDIFKYPESQTELRRIELYGPLSEDDGIWQNGIANAAVITAPGADTGPSTLPQILHLSHKNYAQFKLEYLTTKFEALNVTLSQVLTDAVAALDHFVEALDKDDSDLDLWRSTASVGGMLDSQRVARFCLEAVLDGDDEGPGSVLSLPGLEEGMAGEQLRHLISQFEDTLSLLQAPLSTTKRKILSKMLKQRLASYQPVIDRKKALEVQQIKPALRQPERVLLPAPKTWAEMGQMLLQQLMAEQNGGSSTDPGISIAFDLNSATEHPLQAIETGSSIDKNDATIAETQKDTAAALEQNSMPEPSQTSIQPEKAAVEPRPNGTALSSTEEDLPLPESPTMTLPTRKRSGDVAGINDSPEEGRAKSKRTRTRESTTGDDTKQMLLDANTRWELEQKLAELQAADDWMFETVGNLFERIGIVGFEAGKDVRQGLQSPTVADLQAVNDMHPSKRGLELAKWDLQIFLRDYSDKLAHVLMLGGETLDFGQKTSSSGFVGGHSNGLNSKAVSKPLDMPNDTLVDLLERVNEQWLMTEEVVWLWLEKLLRPKLDGSGSTYLLYCWPEELKTMVVRSLVNFDESIARTAQEKLETMQQGPDSARSSRALAEMIETIFELHLDIFRLIKKANSGVDAETVAAQSDRLQQWSALAREVTHLRCASGENASINDELNLRFLWATTFAIGADDSIEQAHVIECLNDLRENFVAAEGPTIELQNNAIMPELSLAALDREITQLTTKDFFLKVTSQDEKDPVAIIESLEPLLGALMDSSPADDETESQQAASATLSPDLVGFLESSDLSVRLLLWQRLRDAYVAIDYKPMVVSCCFKMITVLLNEVRKGSTAAASSPDGQVAVLRILRLTQELVAKAFAVIQNSKNAFECIDESGLKASVTSFGEILQLLQVFNINEDLIRIGKKQAPTLPNGLIIASFENVNETIHKMQVQIWIILYGLLKESIFQFHDLFPNPGEDTFEFLKVVHRNLGLRGICGSSNRAFVRMLKDEFFQMTHVEGYESEQAQVLYDLYGLNCFLNPSYELMEHNCTHDAFIDRSVAVQAIDLLLSQASKLPMKDLVKHPIRDTIDKVHGAAPRKKPTDAIMRNREIQRAFLRSPINPLDLYSCLKGEGNQLNVSPIPKEDALLASKGWYFLMGHIALAKFRSQKRTGPTPTEDVDIAIAFFMQDLEYTADHWETWFRLAQAYDTKIEESVVWSAEKLNNSMNEIVQLQRATIHCYTMATALAYRSADLNEETSEKTVELFHDFATRLYSSSREPFAMLPFALDDSEKFFSYEDRPIWTGKPFQPLRPYTVWKLAKVLYQKVMVSRADSWTLHFNFGKCLWKMHTASDRMRGSHNIAPTAQEVLSSFIRAIELIPDKDKKDSREKREPVLEPHYKLVSIVHKLVSRQEITLSQAKEALDNTPYARTVTFPDEIDEWVPHVLAVLKTLRAADKSNWHHRMIARAAQIVYDDSDPRADADGPSQNLGAIGAKHELTQQMFTKTMVLQVWRPECERPGRHFVYTTRYTRFFVRLLEQLRDRANLEMLARRVRRRPHDLFEHALVWQDICYAYLRLLRSYAGLAEGLETSTFSTIAHEDFLERKEPLEKWMKAQETGSSSALDVLREVQELKKINVSLMKPGSIDDLIGDAYAYLFNTVGKQLWEEERRIKQEEAANRPPPPVVSPPRNPMMSLTNLMNVDGTSDPPTSIPPAPSSQPTQPSTDGPARRKIGVGRREIRASAEACFQKANVVPVITSTKPLPRVQVIIDTNKEHVGGDVSVETSAPGSIHDSADDESELSELEEEGENGNDSPPPKAEPRPMFPGLLSRMESREVSDGFETAEEGPVEKTDVEMVDQAEDVQDQPVVTEASSFTPVDQ